MRMSEWIEPELHRDFIAQQTDALRLCTCPDGWVERFGVDVLISHKTDAALERLKTELCLWALNVDFKFRRVFARFLPKQNAEREAPRLILGDPGHEPAKARRSNARSRYAIDFAAGYSVGPLHRSAGKPAVRAERRAWHPAELFRLHLLVSRWRRQRSGRRQSASIFRKNRWPGAGKILRSTRCRRPTIDSWLTT